MPNFISIVTYPESLDFTGFLPFSVFLLQLKSIAYGHVFFNAKSFLIAFLDNATGLYWLVPCSSKIEKFERLIQKKKEQHKPTDTIRIVKIFDRKTVLLFQDMFPAAARYIDGQYIKGGQAVRIADPKLILELEKTARKIIGLLHRGIRFTPTQPDVIRIERLMIEELKMQ